MIAYTAWDSLRAIARQYDADLTFDSGERLALTPQRERPMIPTAVRRLTARVRAGLAGQRAATHCA